MLRDEAHAFLQAGAAIEAGRHGAADAARRAAADGRRRRGARCATARRSRCCRPSAASRPTGAPCPAPPNARPGRALPALRARLPGLGRLLGRRAARRADRRRRQLPQLAAGAAPRPAGRRPRLPLARADGGRRRWPSTLGTVQRELAQVDADIAERYFGGARAAGRQTDAPPDALRDPLPDRVPLRRRRSRTTSTRCASSPATTPTQRVDDFGVRVDPETRLHQHLDYFGTTVIEFGISQAARPPVDRRARARGDRAPPPEPPDGAVGARSRSARYREAGGRVPAAVRRRARRRSRSTSSSALTRARDAAGHAAHARRADPRPLRVPRRA